jgi:hypothetical protein
LNVHRLSDVRQKEILSREILTSESISLEAEVAVANFKEYKSSGINQIPGKLIQARGEILNSEIHKLINSVWNKEEISKRWKKSLIVPFDKQDDKTDCRNYRGILL